MQVFPLNSEFSFDVTDLIYCETNQIEVVGDRYGVEITRQKVTIDLPTIEMSLKNYKIGDTYITGKVTSNQATQVLFYVNRRHQTVAKVSDDDTFNYTPSKLRY